MRFLFKELVAQAGDILLDFLQFACKDRRFRWYEPAEGLTLEVFERAFFQQNVRLLIQQGGGEGDWRSVLT